MYFLDMRVDYAIAFISGLNQGFENTLLNGFQSWLVDEYFHEPQSFAWEVLIKRIPECSTQDDAQNLKAFLDMLDRYLVFIESNQDYL